MKPWRMLALAFMLRASWGNLPTQQGLVLGQLVLQVDGKPVPYLVVKTSEATVVVARADVDKVDQIEVAD